ncbi:MAG: hypothetical protein ACOY16_10250, partial [Chloroflexota bacterium]
LPPFSSPYLQAHYGTRRLSFGGWLFNVIFQPGWSVFILQNTHGFVSNPEEWSYSSYGEWVKRGLYPNSTTWEEPKFMQWGE